MGSASTDLDVSSQAGGSDAPTGAVVAADLAMLPAAAGCWAGAWWAVAQKVSTALTVGVVMTVLATVIFGGLALRARSGGESARHPARPGRRRRSSGLTALGLVAAGMAACCLSAAAQNHARLSGVEDLLGARVNGVVTVRAPPHRLPSLWGAERWAVQVRLEEVVGAGAVRVVHSPLLVTGDQAWGRLRVGDRVRVTGRLAAADPGDDVVGYLRPGRAPDVIDSPGVLDRLAEHVRSRLRQSCSSLPPDSGGLLPGLVVGDTSALPEGLAEDMRATGLTHLTAVSGANITIVAGSVLAVAGWAGVARRRRLVLAGVAILCFVVIAGPEPSVLRAAAMGAVGLLGLVLTRRGAGLPALWSAVVMLTIVDPWLGRAFGFALSVVATAGLLLLTRPFTDTLGLVLPRWLAVAVAVPTAAQIAVGPITVLMNPQLPLLAVPANLLVSAAVAPATVLGALAALAGVGWAPLGEAFAWLASWPVRWIAVVARTAADVPGSTLPWPSGPSGAALLGIASVLVVGVGSGLTPTLSRWVRRQRAVLALGAAVVAFSLMAGLPSRLVAVVSGWPMNGWLVAACDVGQGTAVAVASGPGAAVVLDVGPDPSLVDGCLSRLGVTRIDLLVLTHFHADHVRGLPGLVKGRTLSGALISALPEPAAQFDEVRAVLAGAGAPVSTATLGQSGRAGEVSYRVVGPVRPHGGADDEEGAAVNNASVAVWLEVDGLRLVALGDAETEEQRDIAGVLAADPGLTPVDVVVVAHHGSARQFRGLYARLQSRVALVTVGADNDYGHPTAQALGLLTDLDALVVRTDTCGDVLTGFVDGRLVVRCRVGHPP
jgi:competence protein ComEC